MPAPPVIPKIKRATVREPIDGAIAMNALALAAQASKRIPMVDSLIAAVACQNQAILVHRDQHFENIPTTLLKMESLHKGLEGL